MISRRVQSMNVSGVRKMFELAKTMKNPIDLSVGLPDFDTPKKVKQAAITAIQSGNNKYTSSAGLLDLRQRISKKLKQENDIEASTEQILVTAAGAGAFAIILPVLVDPGDEVILTDPYFVSHYQVILQNNAIPVLAETNPDFSLNVQAIREKITKKTKAIVIVTPNNPTGRVYSKKELRELALLASAHDLVIIADEIYEKFCYDQPHISIGSMYEKTVTINGFSKGYGMTGWRVGYCAGPQEIIDQAIKIQQFSYVCAPTPLQRGAIVALDTSMRKTMDEYKKKRDLVYNGLRKWYAFTKPAGAFYAFIQYPYNAEEFIKRCISHELLIVPGNVFSSHNTHFRIAYGISDETLQKAIKILQTCSKRND